jgi:hypothetical protein
VDLNIHPLSGGQASGLDIRKIFNCQCIMTTDGSSRARIGSWWIMVEWEVWISGTCQDFKICYVYIIKEYMPNRNAAEKIECCFLG